MDRVWIATLVVLTIALVRMCDCQTDSTGDRQEGAGAPSMWDQLRSRARSPGHSARGQGNTAVPARPSGESSRSSHNASHTARGTPATFPRSPSPRHDNRRATVTKAIPPSNAGAPHQEEDATLPRDGALRTARQLGTHHSSQRRSRIGSRQNKPSSPQTRRLAGPNVCGGQQCCSGWVMAPGTNRCIKPDCQPPCLNRGSCSRPHTCVCRSGFQGRRCEEVAPEQVYIRTGGSLRRVEPGANPFQRDQPSRRRTQERQAAERAPTSGPAATRQPLHTATQVRRGPPDSSPQQTGTSRTVKRYPSSPGPITSNALPNGNRHSSSSRLRNGHGNGRAHDDHRPAANGQLQGQFNNAVSPAGANLTSSLDRIKIVFTPMVCRRVCDGGSCYNSCKKGDTTTVYSENQHRDQTPKSQGFRLFFCQIPCLNGGRCIGRDHCWCPSNSTGKFCHLPAPPPARHTLPVARKDAGRNSSHSMYTLPLSNQQVSMHPSLVNVHIQLPPEAEVQIHQVARVKPGQRPPSTDGAHSVQQRSQPANGNGQRSEHAGGHGNGHPPTNGNSHPRPSSRQNGYVGRCFQETVDGQCGKPLPGLTKQDDCCGSVGASWGLNKCTECPIKPAYAVIANGQVECPKGFKRMNLTHCQDINECLMPGICKNAECINTKGSYRCTCKPGFMLDPARSHCVSDKAVSEQKEMCYRSVSAGSCSLHLSHHLTKQICCCSRVGKAWGTACERCPLPGSDHFKEICPAGHGYTYSRSDVQISMRQLEEEELRRPVVSWEPQLPQYPETPRIPLRPQPPQTPQYPQTTRPHQPQYPVYPALPDPQDPQTHQPQYPVYPAPDPQLPTRETTRRPEDVEILSPPPVMTESPLKYPDVLERATLPPINVRPESDGRDTASIDVATKVTDIDKCSIAPGICGNGLCVPVQTGYTCYCDPGYKLSALQTNCIDVNECEEDPCGVTGNCVNTFGSYTCHCYSGYSQVITQNRKFCQDVNECDMPNKCQDGECVNTDGSYTCECRSGYAKSSRGRCEDVDECRDPGSCADGRCVNTPGSFQCHACEPGYRAANGQCVDVNECLDQSLCAHGRCVNAEGSYSCNCYQGYQASPDNGACQDVDECLLPGVCLHGRCVNLDGSHRCTCSLGYRVSSDGSACEDVDECATRNVCPTGICANTEGSYSCQNCRPGFGRSVDGLRCEDVDECAQADMCLGGVCVNSAGSFSCTRCTAGYRVSEDGRSCEDLDECRSLTLCGNGICLNSEGSYSCISCPSGFVVSPDGELCEDIDECALPSTCPRGTCTNSMGSFTCVTCKTGFRVSETGQKCEDIDECLVSNVCPGQLCRNTPGSFACRGCETGFQLSEDGYGCEDVDECQSPGVCQMGVCTNTEGSYSCMTCDLGFALSPGGLSCEDINECEGGSHCLGGKCTNTLGSYRCSCPPGMELVDGETCIDINECESRGICGDGDCLNTDGSYVCICPDGYTSARLGVGCQDVDECSKDSVCVRGRCVNTDGSYLCLCEIGFKFSSDTADCEDQNECKEFGSSVCGTWRCENTIGSYRCFMGCQAGPDGEVNPDCDIDECVNETICGDHGFCENMDGSYRCQCDLGYTNPPGDIAQACVDVNECEMSMALCGEALCENVDGSFLCICPSDNEEFDPIASQCRSLAEMDAKPTPPAAFPSAGKRRECYYNLNDANFCDNVLSYNTTKEECCCTVGSGWGDNCEIHPCPVPGREEYNQLCPHGGGLLSQVVSSPQSVEQQPFRDINECEMFGPDICKNGRCSNLFSTYSCFCRSGFYYDNIRLECVDYDECETEKACVDGVCVNTAGSYNCFCSPPLVLDATRRHCISINVTEESQELDEDIHLDICWQGLQDEHVCSQPLLGRRTTYTECCCLYGVAWSEHCAFCPTKDSDDYATMCNLPRRGSDSLRERPGYEYGPEVPGGTEGPYSPYWDNYGGPLPGGGTYYNPGVPHGLPLFTDSNNDYGLREREPPLRVPVYRPREFQPQPLSPYNDRYDGFEGLRAEECGVLNGCENGRCVRVREGYTCDCFDGFELDLNKMACIDINECEDISDKVALCKNGLCTNTEGSYKCSCLPGFQASAKPHECIPEIPEVGSREAAGN